MYVSVDLQLPEDKEWDVHITYISTSLMSVMLRLVGEEYSEKLDAYQAKLEEAFRGCSSEAPIQEGVTYIAYDDDLFHRVRMISEKDGKVRLLIDPGSKVIKLMISFSSLKLIFNYIFDLISFE